MGDAPGGVWFSGLMTGLLICGGVLLTALSIQSDPAEASNNTVIWAMYNGLAVLLLFVAGKIMPDIMPPQRIVWQQIVGYALLFSGLILVIKKW